MCSYNAVLIFTKTSLLYLAFQCLRRDQQWPVHLFLKGLWLLFILSLKELHRLHPSSWDQDYCLVVRDAGSRLGCRTKHGPSGSPFVLSYPRGPACMSVCYISVKSCQFRNSMSQDGIMSPRFTKQQLFSDIQVTSSTYCDWNGDNSRKVSLVHS